MRVSYTHCKRGCSENGRNVKGQEQTDYVPYYSSGRIQVPLQRWKQRGEEGFSEQLNSKLDCKH